MKRIYVVIEKSGKQRFVEAASAAQAIRHVVKNQYEAHVANQKDFLWAMENGVKVEKANAESADETTGEQLEFPGILNPESNGIQPNRETN